MNETKRVHSIARKIQRAWMRSVISALISVNILVLLVFAGYGIYVYESSILADEWQPRLERRFQWEGDRSLDTLPDVEYCFQSPDGAWHCAPLRPVLQFALPPAVGIIVCEILIVQERSRRAKKRVHELLRPLNKIASDMEAVSRLQDDSVRYEDRLRDLESAIDGLSPTRPDAQLRTNVQELTGLESSINNLLRRMHESYRQQAQFVSDASHELRTPIAVIQGYARMLERWGKDDPQVLEESIAAIGSESAYMKKLVDELLFLARGEIGRNPFDPKPLSLTGLIREVCGESAMIDPNHTWVFRESPEVEITADAEMLKQCARVLCENARKYTPDGGEIAMSVAENGDQVSFAVQDEGVGIGSGDLPHVFDRFYRSDPARDRNSGGSGLGLAIAKWIVDRHGGSFDVLSSEGMGTRFTVHLPKI